MVRPGSGDRKISLLITGDELDELKNWTWAMGEAFGLDRKFVMDTALKDGKEYPDKSAPGYQALLKLNERLVDEYRKAYGR